MARGWESKAVEDQIASAEDRKALKKRALTHDERERQSRQAGLMLSRAKIVRDIESARDERHRASLMQALAYIDDRLREL